MSNYVATIVKIDNLRPHSNADKLICTNIFGNNVIVGKDTQIGDIGIFFCLESQIGTEFAVANDLIRRKDENGKSVGGMFDANRRVRAQTLRGEKSMGFFAPISSLTKTFDYLKKECPKVEIGQEFEELNGISISKKYVTPTNYFSNSNIANGKKIKKSKESRMIDGQFRFHFDTCQLGKNIHKVQPDNLISVTWKLHGTSGIVSHILVKKNLKWYERLFKFMGVDVVDSVYDHIFSSRKVVKNATIKEDNGYYNFDIWTDAGEKFKGKLRKGESVYYELVGNTPNGKCIQKGYDYCCPPNEYKIYAYRITQTNVDGDITELPWHQVVNRAAEIGVETVPEIYYGKAKELFDIEHDGADVKKWQDEFYINLLSYFVNDQDSQFCNNKVPEEGVVLRLELGDGIENLKLKSWAFLNYETKMLDAGVVDMEEVESI